MQQSNNQKTNLNTPKAERHEPIEVSGDSKKCGTTRMKVNTNLRNLSECGRRNTGSENPRPKNQRRSSNTFLPSTLNGNDNDHSSSQLRVHSGLTCPEGQSAWALALPCLARYSHHAKILRRVVPLGLKWVCSCRSNGGMSHDC